MRHIPGRAGAMGGVIFMLTIALGGCGTESDRGSIEGLVNRFMSILAPGGQSVRAADLPELFTGIDGSARSLPPAGIASVPRVDSYRIGDVRLMPFGRASVTVTVSSEKATTILSLRARRVGGTWKLEPAIGIRQRLDEVKRASP
jgi:hypothetical protein